MEFTVYILFFLCSLSAITIGYFLGKKAENKEWMKKPYSPEEIKQIYQTEINKQVNEALKKEFVTNSVPQQFKTNDVINTEGVGIVYRPSKQELDKINEPEQIRLAKEAIAQTLRQEVPPQI